MTSTEPPRDVSFSSITAHPSGTIFGAAGDKGIFISHDTGRTYQPLSRAASAPVTCTAILTLPDGTLLAGDENATYRSTDIGNSWSRIPLQDVRGVRMFILRPPNPDVLCLLQNGTLLSTNGGEVWHAVEDSGMSLTFHVAAGGFSGKWFGVSTDGHGNSRLLTSSNGSLWTPISSYTRAHRVRALASHKGHLAIGLDNGMEYSTDGGQTWIDLGGAFSGRAVNIIHVAPDETMYVGCTARTPSSEGLDRQAGVFRSYEPMGGQLLLPPWLLAPQNEEWVTSAIDTLLWAAVPGAERYEVQLCANFSFVWRETATFHVTVPAFPTDSLPRSKRYYWRVRAENVKEEGPWSHIRNFYTNAEVPRALRISPVTGEMPVTVWWASAAPYPGYRVQCSYNPAFTQMITDTMRVAGTSLALPWLIEYIPVYWRVAVNDGKETGPWSIVSTFTPIPTKKLSPPVLYLPNNQYLWVSQGTRLEWYRVPNAETYTIEIARDPACASIVFRREGITLPYIDPDTFALYTPYYWRVRSHNNQETSEWSRTWMYQYAAIPEVPVLESPADGARLVSCDVELLWERGAGTVVFEGELSNAVGFQNPISFETKSDTLWIWSLVPNRQYQWHIRARNPIGTSAWSAARTFTTGTVVGVRQPDPAAVVKPRPTLTNHPNPFSRSSMIHYSLSEHVAVTLTIHDALGRLVATLVDDVREAGTHHARFDAQGLPAGVYTARLDTPSGSTQHVMLLVR